jgi:ribosome-associated protein
VTDSHSRPVPGDPFGSSPDEIDGEVEDRIAALPDTDTVAEADADADTEVEATDVTEPVESAESVESAEAPEPLHLPSPDGLPHRTTPAPHSADLEALAMARRIVELAEDKKAADIVLLDVTELTTMADYFVICTGGSDRQVGAIADSIAEGLHKEHVNVIGREGEPQSHWVLLDFGVVVVHVFAPPERDFYQLERLWAEAKTVLRVQ